MNKAPQRPYNRYDIPPRRRPPKKNSNFKIILYVLIALIAVLSAVLVIVSIAGRSDSASPNDVKNTEDSGTEDLSTNNNDNIDGTSSGVFESEFIVTTQPQTSPPDDPPVTSHIQTGNDRPKHILIDPGHGFGDVGCHSEYIGKLYEKDLTRAVSGYLKSELESKGYTVSLTHDSNSYIPESELTSKLDSLNLEYKPDKILDNNIFSAYERTMYANVLNNSNPVGVFVSIHVNSNEDSSSLSDFTIDYCGENDSTDLSSELVENVCDALKDSFPSRAQKKFRDSWDESFIVTKYSEMPSFLLEMGYATTPSDAAEMIDAAWQKKLAAALAQGIDTYYNGN